MPKLYLDICQFGIVSSLCLSPSLALSRIENEEIEDRDYRIDLFGGILLEIGVKIRKARYNIPNTL